MKIETIRHSLAHVMAYAVQELYPGVKFGIGPAIKNGFYYDFDLSAVASCEGGLTPQDLPKIEAKMKELIKKGLSFEKKGISKEKAKQLFKNQPYKTELIEDLAEAGPLSIYQMGEFVDLCAGPHVKTTLQLRSGQAKEVIDAFKLTKIAGAYWRGNEKKPMLTRVYGIAFNSKKELEDYLKIQEEAEKRDHRALGKSMDLFHIDDNVGPGLILWHPKGAILKKIIIDYALNEYLKAGYQLVDTPHIAKLNLWKVSGHTDFYKENMLPPMHMAEIGEEEKDDYQIKPMNCPFHIAIYKTKIRSYKDLPIRYTEIGTVYRYEKSGTLHGLTRVRQITQDDAHIICTPDQVSDEICSIIKLTHKILKNFGLKEYYIYLSTKPEKCVGNPKMWDKAENSLKYALKSLNLEYKTDVGGGAFYGPKIDIKIKDSLGREWQCTTIQFDFNLPERFDMAYIDQKGKKQRPFMIHRALLGALERFIGILLEYYGGNLPLWLSPVQAWLIPISSKHEKYAKKIVKELEEAGLRIEMKNGNDTVSKKIRGGEIQKIPYLLVVGDKEMKVKSVRVRSKNKDLGMMKLQKFIKKVTIEVEKKK